MALTVTARGTGTHNTGATSFGLSPNANCTAGALLVLCVAADNSSAAGSSNDFTTVTDGIGNTWTKRQSPVFDNGAASAGVQGAIYTTRQDVGAVQSATVITVNFGSSPVAKTWTLTEVTAAAGKFAQFRTGGDKAAGATGTALTTGASSTVNVGEAIIAAFFLEAGTSQSISAEDTDGTNGSWTTSAYAEIGTTTSGSVIASSTKIQTTANSTQSYDITVGVSSDYHASYIIVSELNAYALAIGIGSFAETGTAVTLKYGRAVAAASGSFTETGTAVTLKATHIIVVGSGSFAESGTAATLKRGLVLPIGAGSFVETGTAATLTYTPVAGHTLTAGSGAFTETGTAATLKVGKLVAAGSGAFAETGTATTLKATRLLATSSGTIAGTGTDATLKCGRLVTALGGTYAETGTASSLKTGRVLSCGSATCSLTGTATTLTYTPFVVAAYTMGAGAGSCAVSGAAATLARSRVFACASGAVACTGSDVTMTKVHPQARPREHARTLSTVTRAGSARTWRPRRVR